MADQRQWWKLWHTSLSDQILENLTLEAWARWARFNAWINVHGESGIIAISEPAKALWSVLKVDSWEAVSQIVTTMPGLKVKCDGTNPVTLYIVVKQWYHYQGDRSADRMRKLRAKRDGMESVTDMLSDKENTEKKASNCLQCVTMVRREEKRSPIVPTGGDFNVFWEAYPSKVGKGAARRAWDKAKRPSLDVILQAIAVQCQSRRWKEGYIPNPATWINQDRWLDGDEPQAGTGPAYRDLDAEAPVQHTSLLSQIRPDVAEVLRRLGGARNSDVSRTEQVTSNVVPDESDES